MSQRPQGRTRHLGACEAALGPLPSDTGKGGSAGKRGVARPAWTAPWASPEPPAVRHARRSTAHTGTARRSHGAHAAAAPGLTPTGHQEALLHVACQRPATGERGRENTVSRRGPGRDGAGHPRASRPRRLSVEAPPGRPTRDSPSTPLCCS